MPLTTVLDIQVGAQCFSGPLHKLVFDVFTIHSKNCWSVSQYRQDPCEVWQDVWERIILLHNAEAILRQSFGCIIPRGMLERA